MEKGEYRLHRKTDALEVDVVGDRDFVVEQFDRLWEEPQATARKKLGPARSPSEMSIGEYVNALRPRNNTETALAIAGYLFKEQNQREFTTQDIEDGFHDILRPLPGNTSQAIANSVKQGFIMKRDKVEGVYHYSVTQSGLERLQEGFGNNK